MAARPERCVCPACGADCGLPAECPKEGPSCDRCRARLLVGRFALLEKTAPHEPIPAYKAFHADLGTFATLRLFGPARTSARAAFFRRAEVLARLNHHPCLAAVYGAGEQEGRLYVVSRLVEGIRAAEASLSVRESAAAVRDAALAVDCAHAANVIHGGLAPGHLWVGPPKRPSSESPLQVLVDGWGPTPSAQPVPAAGAFAFLSPEQTQGKSADARSDVYALGASLYALATGRPPFTGTTPDDVFSDVTEGRVEPPSRVNPGVDASLESIILMSMDRAPHRRYPEASELAQDLTRWLSGGSGIRGPSTRIRERVPEFVLRALAGDARKRRAIAAASAGALLLVLLAAFFVGYGSSKRVSTPVAPAAAAPEGAPPPAELRAAERRPSGLAGLGTVFFLHARFGAFVRLEEGAKVAAGDALAVVRDSEVVADLAVEMVTSPEPLYPYGCAVCPLVGGAPKAGDIVLRKAK